MPRLFAIGDIHGCPKALSSLFEAAAIERADTVITLGDYVAKGPDSQGVLDLMVELAAHCRHVPLLGNHDRMMLAALDGEIGLGAWSAVGGKRVLESYGSADRLAQIPRDHHEFLRGCRLHYETDRYLFTHACYDPELPLCDSDESVLLWKKIRNALPAPHFSGKVTVVGHTSQKCGNVLDAGHLICIDTNCCSGGWLTAIELPSRRIIQADQHGRLRH
jgi:serine/threonine protein phosphatase 1